MSTHGESDVPTSSGRPAIIFAWAGGVPSAIFLGFLGYLGAGFDGTSSELTLPNWAIMGACFGAGAAGLVALLYGCHLGRGFCYLFGAVFGGIACMILSLVFFWTPRDEHQLLKDAIALGCIFLGLLGGTALRRLVTRFGAESRGWARIGAGTALALGAAIAYANMNAQDLASHPELKVGLALALIATPVVALIGALAGAIRDSA